MFDDLLEYLGGALDKPGRSVRGALSGNFGELGAAIPFSDTLGITDPQNAVSGKTLAKNWFGLEDDNPLAGAAGFGVDLLTDPTTYLGAGLGRAAGRALGKRAETAAILRGPGYKTTAEELMLATPNKWRGRLMDMAENPNFESALKEIPQGSSFLGGGAEALAYRTPAGDVARLAPEMAGNYTRPIHPDMLPATRTATMEKAGTEGLRVERAPFAEQLGFGGMTKPEYYASPEWKKLQGWGSEVDKRGLDVWDLKPNNVGMHQGRQVVIDPGAAFADEKKFRFAPETLPSVPDKTTAFLLDLIGGQSAMQKALAAGRAAPQYQRVFGAAGAGIGASTGAF